MSLGGQERFCMVVVHEVVSIIKRGWGGAGDTQKDSTHEGNGVGMNR